MRINIRNGALAGGALAGLAALTLAGAGPARADYPDRPIHVVVGFPAGGGADILVRWYTDKMAALSGGTVVVDNKPGAGGNIGSDAVAKARPDGYTLLMTNSSAIGGNGFIYKNLPFDAAKDFVPVGSLSQLGFVLAINPATKANTVAELTALLKAKNGRSTFGAATTTSLASAEQYKAAGGFASEAVSYKAMAQSLSDLTGGQLDFVWADAVLASSLASAGKVKLLAVTTPRRLGAIPDLPTTIEAGIPSVDIAPWWGTFAPTGTPKDVIEKVSGWLNQINAMPETREFLLKQGAEPLVGSPEATGKLLTDEMARWEKITKLAKIEPQ